MSLSHTGVYLPFTKPGVTGGGTTGYEFDDLLNDDGDPVLQGSGLDELLNSDGDKVLESPGTLPEQILNSDGDHLLNSDGQFVLARGYSNSPVLSTGNKVSSRGA